MDVRSRIEALLHETAPSEGPGLIVAVRRDGAAAEVASRGLAHAELPVAFTPRTRVPIASLTKSMTAFCALRLAEDGRFDIDAPVGRWLPELPEVARRPTPRQLMSHVSGLRCHLEMELFSGYEASRPDGFGLRTLAAIEDANAEPGAWRVYGNSGFHLLSIALSRAAGESFADLMRREVFEPLGMADTALLPGASRMVPGLASLYSGAAGGWRNVSHSRAEFLGEGGVASTLEDMLRWTAALRLGSADVALSPWRAMTTPDAGGSFGYGLGLLVRLWRGTTLIGHGGSLIGVSTAFAVAPQLGAEAVVLANFGFDAEGLARNLIAAAVGEEKLEPAPASALTNDHTGLVGAMFVDEALVVGFGAEDGRLTLFFQGAQGVPLEQDGPRGLAFQGSIGPLRIEPGRDDATITVAQGGEIRTLRRANPPGRACAVRPGVYERPELAAQIRLQAAEDGTLRIETRGPYGRAEGRLEPLVEGVDLARVGPAIFLLRPHGHGLSLSTTRTRDLVLRQTTEQDLGAS